MVVSEFRKDVRRSLWWSCSLPLVRPMKFEDDYTSYWGLRALPFDNVPDPRFYVPCVQHDAAHRWLNYGIQARKGILLLTGDIGCGKTLLSRRLIVGLSPAQYDVALVANPALSPSELLDEVLAQFGLDWCNRRPRDYRCSMNVCNSMSSAGSALCWWWMKRKRLKALTDLKSSAC